MRHARRSPWHERQGFAVSSDASDRPLKVTPVALPDPDAGSRDDAAATPHDRRDRRVDLQDVDPRSRGDFARRRSTRPSGSRRPEAFSSMPTTSVRRTPSRRAPPAASATARSMPAWIGSSARSDHSTPSRSASSPWTHSPCGSKPTGTSATPFLARPESRSTRVLTPSTTTSTRLRQSSPISTR